MPWSTTWVEPKVALKHKGIKVYHTYRHDDVNDILSVYWFTLDPDSDEHQFDVRDLPNWIHCPKYMSEETHIRSILRDAIDLGHLKERESE